MLLWILPVFMMTFSFAEVGRVVKIVGGQDAYILRQGEKQVLQAEQDLEEGDQIFSQSSHVVIQIYPATQMSIIKDSEVTLTQNLIEETEQVKKATSLIELVKGLIRLQVTKEEGMELDQTVRAPQVAFSVRGTDFEVSTLGDDIDLDVYEGDVEVSSPNVQTFVPYHVKAKEGFRYSRKSPGFARRNFAPKLKEPGFVPREKLKAFWHKKRAMLKGKRILRRDERKERKMERVERGERRRKKNR